MIRIIIRIWTAYHIVLWSVKGYVWNPLVSFVSFLLNSGDNFFEAADYYPRRLVTKIRQNHNV